MLSVAMFAVAPLGGRLTALAAGGSALLALRLERGRPLLVLSHET